MKLVKNALWIIIASFLAFSCASDPAGDKAEVSDEVVVDSTATAGAADYAVDTEASKVTWVGTKPVGKHEGMFKITEGTVKVEGNKIVGGSYVIDVTSLTVTDEGADDETKAKLAGHLTSKDFFEIEKYPTAKFEITSVEPYTAAKTTEKVSEEDKKYVLTDPTHMVSGNLEMYGVTKNVKFPAKMSVADGKATARAQFNINRKDWGMSYGADESLGDKFIRPTVHIGFEIAASK
jgi:polyisoprenoid-binding protein YceI